MIEYTLTDKEVRWVLICLNDFHHHSIPEIAERYNRLRPPSLLFPKPKSAAFIEGILKFLMKGESPLVAREIYTFYAEPIPPTKYYSLTDAGIRFINARR